MLFLHNHLNPWLSKIMIHCFQSSQEIAGVIGVGVVGGRAHVVVAGCHGRQVVRVQIRVVEIRVAIDRPEIVVSSQKMMLEKLFFLYIKTRKSLCLKHAHQQRRPNADREIACLPCHFFAPVLVPPRRIPLMYQEPQSVSDGAMLAAKLFVALQIHRQIDIDHKQNKRRRTNSDGKLLLGETFQHHKGACNGPQRILEKICKCPVDKSKILFTNVRRDRAVCLPVDYDSVPAEKFSENQHRCDHADFKEQRQLNGVSDFCNRRN
jgi:hypothetical protein